MGIACRSTKLPEQGPFQYVAYSAGITLIFRSTITYSSGGLLSFHDHNRYLNMMVNEQVKSECCCCCCCFFEPLSFTAALGKHNLDCRTSLMDGEQKDGLLDSFLSFGSDFLFFPLSRHANKLASKNVSLAFLIGEMFLRVGEKMMSHFFSRMLFVLCL